LKRAEVLLRRLDSDFADPLELSARSRLGVPGLVQAIRDGTVVMANALGSGVVEARAMLSFLPALAPAVLGRELALPNVATWWLGQDSARDEIVERLDEMVLASAFVGELPGHHEQREVLGAALEPHERQRILEQIAHRGIDFVAKEAVNLSTTPVWRNGRLEPRPFTLRLFLARASDGWRVMPGGFVRVADDIDARAVSLQRGGSTGDAWVLSDKPVAETTLLPAPDRITITRATGALPSRTASNLFWLARYVERAEYLARILEVTQRLTNQLNDILFPNIVNHSESSRLDRLQNIFVVGTRLSLATVVPIFHAWYAEAILRHRSGFEPAVRFEYFDPDRNNEDDGRTIWTGQLAFSFSPNFRWQVNASREVFEGSAKKDLTALVSQWTVRL
jgi:hypothetical protein